jgi:hypothetical protein
MSRHNNKLPERRDAAIAADLAMSPTVNQFARLRYAKGAELDQSGTSQAATAAQME